MSITTNMRYTAEEQFIHTDKTEYAIPLLREALQTNTLKEWAEGNHPYTIIGYCGDPTNCPIKNYLETRGFPVSGVHKEGITWEDVFIPMSWIFDNAVLPTIIHDIDALSEGSNDYPVDSLELLDIISVIEEYI